MYCHMITAAKEEMLSSFAPWCAETCISASAGENQKPRQGFARKNPALHLGHWFANSRTPLGLPICCSETALGPAVAANNGLTPQQQIKQQTQQCISQFNNSAFGEFVNFWSMASPLIGPNRLGSTIEDVGGTTLKFGVYQFFNNASQSMAGTPFGSMSGVVAEGIETIAKDVVLPVAVGSTGLQILAQAGCNTGARQDAGQMNALPPGIISGNP
jgi:hypothetical protein